MRYKRSSRIARHFLSHRFLHLGREATFSTDTRDSTHRLSRTIYTSTHETRDWLAVVRSTSRSRSSRRNWPLPQLEQRASSPHEGSGHLDANVSSIARFRRDRIRTVCAPIGSV